VGRGDRTVADAILDRLVHNSHRLVLKGESMRKRRAPAPVNPPTTEARQR
jgi:DNA replication protein DnaC